MGNVLQKLDLVNLKINLDKCRFAQNEIKILGHVVNGSGIKPNPNKIEIIQNLNPPTSVTGVKSFLGVINFFRKFIPNCSTISEPIVSLTRKNKNKDKKIIWEEDQQILFNLLKQKLMNAPILKFPDYSKEFIIETDALSVGLGAVLAQEYEVDNSLINFPIAYASRSLSKAERNYSVTDQEGLAVV